MRKILLLSVVLLPQLTAADEGILRKTADKLRQVLQQSICKTLRPAETTCDISIESATHHQLGGGSVLWALAWKANTTFRVKGEAEHTMRDTLERLQVQVLDIFPDHFTGIAYFRQQGKTLEQLSSAAFSMAALNTTRKAVARLAPELFLKGDVQYVLPEKWQSQGLSALDRGAITLTIPAWAGGVSISLRDLDDARLAAVRIESCRLLTAGRESDCNPGQIGALSKSAVITLQLAAEKKLKAAQPAFKLVLQDAASEKFLLHLAIPFRPRSNYLVFGVAGFLFGALIAVMVLLMRKNPAAAGRS
jgi:hypothetical protein